MEELSGYIFLLAAYHFLFFKKFYLNPYLMATGELLSTTYPVMVWQGRQWKKGKIPLKDDIYYYEPASIPFLSTFYPPHTLTSMVIASLRANYGHLWVSYMLLLHVLLGSILAFCLFLSFSTPLIALFGAITWMYGASSIKLNTASLTYTLAWIPGIFLGGPIGGICLGMSLLGGYWPILIYFIPTAIGAYFLWGYNIFWLGIGVLIAIPQIILFLKYYPRSIRSGKLPDANFGRVPVWKFLDLLRGDRRHCYINGIGYPEMCLYCGFLTPILAIYSDSRAWILLIISLILCFWSPLRIPARALHLLTFSLTWMACSGLTKFQEDQTLIILLVQGFSLLHNNDIYPHHPFAEPIKKPEEWFKKFNDINKYPYFTGYLTETKTKGYTGGFALKETCARNGVTNPMGEAIHE